MDQWEFDALVDPPTRTDDQSYPTLDDWQKPLHPRRHRMRRKARRQSFKAQIILFGLALLCTVIAYINLFPIKTVRAVTVRKVYSGGTSAAGDTTYTLSQLQNAIDDAAQNDACGSEILLQQDAVFSAPDNGFILRQLSVSPT